MSVSAIGSIGGSYGSYGLSSSEMQERMAARFAQEDLDGDESLSVEEFGGPEELFSEIDADGDGLLTEQEMQSHHEAKMAEGPPADAMGMAGGMTPEEIAGRILAEMDSDEDGGLSISELGVSDNIFAEADTDGDGIISQAELEVTLQDLASQRADAVFETLGGNTDGELSASEMGSSGSSGASGSSDDEEDYDDMDTNKDGVVSREEYEAAMGSVSSKGLAAYLIQMLGQNQAQPEENRLDMVA